MMKLKPYMAFSFYGGPEEGASLVVAYSAKEARVLAYRTGCIISGDGDWIDTAVRLIRNDDVLKLADRDKVRFGVPHVIDSPVYCQHCGHWGCGLTDDDLCGGCNEPPGDDLVSLLRDESEVSNGPQNNTNLC